MVQETPLYARFCASSFKAYQDSRFKLHTTLKSPLSNRWMNELPDRKNCPLFTYTSILHNLLLWLVVLAHTPAWFGAGAFSYFFSNFCFTLLFPPRYCIGLLLQTEMSLIVQGVRRELITKSVFWEFTTHLWSISLACYPLSSVLSLVMESWHLWALIFALPLNHWTISF